MAKAAKVKKSTLNLTTEEKILKAARKLFMKKGFAATRTRDISEEAGINLALLNYYYRSKEKLFELVMTEILQNFFAGISGIFDDESTTVDEKAEAFVTSYTTLLTQQPDLPLFIFHELRMNPEKLASRMGVSRLFKSFFFRQLEKEMQKKKGPSVNPLHYLINMVGMCVFPFIAAPILKHVAGLSSKDFTALTEERKKLIPVWMKAIMERR